MRCGHIPAANGRDFSGGPPGARGRRVRVPGEARMLVKWALVPTHPAGMAQLGSGMGPKAWDAWPVLGNYESIHGKYDSGPGPENLDARDRRYYWEWAQLPAGRQHGPRAFGASCTPSAVRNRPHHIIIVSWSSPGQLFFVSRTYARHPPNRIPIVYQSYTIVYLIRAPGATWDFGGILARWASLAPFDFGAHCDIPHRTPYSSN